MTNDGKPKVFLSYAWGRKETQNIVEEIAQKLTNDGIVVRYDQWDLQYGADLNSFMESIVHDEEIDFVLVFSDINYQHKADCREGGVGTETQIISSEVYNNIEQSKFIPIALECDSSNNFSLPIYMKSRLAVDLTNLNKFEESYQKILRTIYREPKTKRPAIGNKPNFSDDKYEPNFELTLLKCQIISANNIPERTKIADKVLNTVIDRISNILETADIKDIQDYLSILEKTLPIRDLILDLFYSWHEDSSEFSDFAASLIEKIVNRLNSVVKISDDISREIIYNFIFEVFLGTVSIFLYRESYLALHEMLDRTYFFEIGDMCKPTKFYTLYRWPEILERELSQGTNYENYYTVLGEILVSQRTNGTYLTKDLLVQSDYLLFNYSQYLKNEFDFVDYPNTWFPRLYIYLDSSKIFWKKLVSKHQTLKMAKLFGVDSCEKMVEIVKNQKTIHLFGIITVLRRHTQSLV